MDKWPILRDGCQSMIREIKGQFQIIKEGLNGKDDWLYVYIYTVYILYIYCIYTVYILYIYCIYYIYMSYIYILYHIYIYIFIYPKYQDFFHGGMDDHLPQSSDHGTDVEFDKRTTQKERGDVQQEAWNYVTLCIYYIYIYVIYYI